MDIFLRHSVDNQGFPGVFAGHSLLNVSVIAFAVPSHETGSPAVRNIMRDPGLLRPYFSLPLPAWQCWKTNYTVPCSNLLFKYFTCQEANLESISYWHMRRYESESFLIRRFLYCFHHQTTISVGHREALSWISLLHASQQKILRVWVGCDLNVVRNNAL